MGEFPEVNNDPVYGKGFLLFSRRRKLYCFKNNRLKYILRLAVRFHERINKHKHKL